MTYQTTVIGPSGPIENAFVFANVEETGASFTRFTDGRGYADVAILGAQAVGDHVTFVVEADGFRRSSQYLTVTAADVPITVVLVPFV